MPEKIKANYPEDVQGYLIIEETSTMISVVNYATGEHSSVGRNTVVIL